MRITISVYSNTRWRETRKANYLVKGEVRHLADYCKRLRAADKALDPDGMTEYHVIDIDPFEVLTDTDWANESLQAFSREVNPWMYDVCDHGMAAWLCEGPQHYPLDI